MLRFSGATAFTLVVLSSPGPGSNPRVSLVASNSSSATVSWADGTLRKSAGSGTSTISVRFDNTGAVEVLNGTLALQNGGSVGGQFSTATGTVINLSGGNFVEQGVPVFSGSGTSRLTGGTLTLTSDAIANLSLAGGTVIVSSTFQGGSISNLTLAGADLKSTNVVTGTMEWTGGTMSGSLRVASSGLLRISGSAVKYLQGPLTNEGTVVWTGTGNLTVYDNNAAYEGAIHNLAGGLFDIQNDELINCACYGNELFRNAGTVRKSGGRLINWKARALASKVLTGVRPVMELKSFELALRTAKSKNDRIFILCFDCGPPLFPR